MTSRKKIIFRADADLKIGYGHFIRSLALAEMLKEDFDCTFYTQTPTDYQKEEVHKVCKLVGLPTGESKFSKFLDCLTGEEIVVLDNYFFTPDYQLKIKRKGCKLVCIGPNDRHYYADVLFNFAEYDSTIFSVEPYTQIKLGIDWIILRKPFCQKKLFRQTKKDKSIVICFGGTDQFFLTERCVKVLEQLEIFNVIHLIATDSFGRERIEKLKNRGVECHLNANAEKVATLLREAETLICSSSTIAIEGLACQIPVICGYYIDNQEKMYKYLVDGKFVLGLSDLSLPEMEEKLVLYLNNLGANQQGLEKKSFTEQGNRYLELFKSI